MKKHLLSFCSGVITTLLIVTLITPALADSVKKTIEATLNSIGITFNGSRVAGIGDTYTASNGEKVPYSIVYTDKKGGGTTYLPMRKLCDILGLNVEWDNNTQTANITNPNTGSNNNKPVGDTNPSTNPSSSQANNSNIITDTEIFFIKIKDKYYKFNNSTLYIANYYVLNNETEQLIFTNDVNAIGSLKSSSWYLNFAIDLANMGDLYTITPSDNPYIDGIIKMSLGSKSFYNTAIGGQEKTVYTSAISSYTPTWVEYNGVKIYKLNEYQNGLYEVNGIHYYNNQVCINDLFDKWGINKKITIGDYQGLGYIEIN